MTRKWKILHDKKYNIFVIHKVLHEILINKDMTREKVANAMT